MTLAADATEMMTVTAARMLSDEDVCFVGIGPPSAACNLARLTHAPDITLIYESGTLATRPDVLPLSIGDGELHDTALATVSVPEMFRTWLQGGRITVGFLGAAQIDARANINTTVIGEYAKPKVRLPGGGGAPEIATQAAKIFVTAKQGTRAFVERIDFRTSLGHGAPGETRGDYGVTTAGPCVLISDLAVWTVLDGEGRDALHADFDARSCELTVTSLHPGTTWAMMRETVGWDIRYAEAVTETLAPSDEELEVLRALHARTAQSHEPDPTSPILKREK